MKSLDFIGYGRGPLARQVGDALSADGVPVSFGSLRCLGALEDWSYTRFDEKVHVRWQHQTDGTFESQFPDTEVLKLSVPNLPDARGYASNDLWEPHPIKADFWCIYMCWSARRRDHPSIGREHGSWAIGDRDHAVAGGQWCGYLRARAELGRGAHRAHTRVAAADVDEFRNIIRPTVEEANKEASAFSGIFKEMIVVTDSSKPLPRVSKNTVAKRAAVKLYAAEIDALAQSAADVQPPETWGENDVEAWLGVQAADIHSAEPIDVDTDLFSQGFDSLSATFLRNRIMGTLRLSSDPQAFKAVRKVTQNFVFSHPTIRQLSAHIAQLVSGAAAGPASATLAIEKMIEKYSAGLTDTPSRSSKPPPPPLLLCSSPGPRGRHC